MSQPKKPGRSSGPELSFRVFGKALHPDWFPVKAHQRVAKDDWSADVRVIDRGHTVTWALGPHRITEVLGPRGLQLPSDGLLYEAPVGAERCTSLRPTSSVEYQTSFEAEEAEPDLFAHLSEEIALDSRRALISFRFEGGSRMTAAGIAQICVEAKAKGLLVHAFHTFPEERAIVRTQSLFESKLALPKV